jgi:hypothetical protein
MPDKITMGIMKTLASAADREAIVRRLHTVVPESPRRWGRMSAHQMLCHLTDVFRSSMGERRVKSTLPIVAQVPVRWVAIWLPLRWPRGFPAPPEWDQMIAGTPPSNFEQDRSELLRIFARFTEQPRTFAWSEHAIFGHLSDREWQRLGYRHMDHHLRQFGA